MKKALTSLLVLLMLVPTFAFAEGNAPYEWNFNKDGEFEGFSIGNAEGTVKDGILSCICKPNTSKEYSLFDPMISTSKIDLDANNYKYLIIKIKTEMIDKDSDVMTIYYRTPGASFAEETTKQIPLEKSNDFVEYIADMSDSPKWKGTIEQLRFDPFNADGKFAVDYIKFVKDKPASLQTVTDDKKDDKTETKPDAKPEVKPETKPDTTEKEEIKFKDINKFTASTFADVGYSAWYYKYVGIAFKTGLMNGVADKIFDPDGTVSVAQAITMASRVNHIYNGGNGVITKQNAKNWYDAYVDYAVEKKIIKTNQFKDMNAPISRLDMGIVFANAVPTDYYTVINAFKSIPDVDSKSVGFSEILKLYNSGIITGSDEQFNFKPNDNIKRSEVAAIISRVAIKSERVRKMTPEEVEAEKKAKEETEKKAAEEAAAKAEAEKKAESERIARAKETAIKFDFDKADDRISLGNCLAKPEFKNGFMLAAGKASDKGKYDPIVYFTLGTLDLSSYKYVRIGMKWKAESKISGTKPSLFFVTAEDKAWAEDKRVSAQIAYPADESSEVVEFIFKCGDNAKWKGTLSAIRFDPFDAAGLFEIDYIYAEEG